MPIKPVEDFTTQEKTDFRSAINAETTEIGWLERFSRYADDTQISTGSVSENGNVWQISQQVGFTNTVVKSGALEPLTGDLYYAGGAIATPGKRLSLTVVLELRENPDYTAGTAVAGMVFGVGPIPHATNLPWFGGGGTGCLHIDLRNNGVVAGLFNPSFPGGPPAYTIDGALPGFVVPTNKRILANLTVIGDVCTVSWLGKTIVYRSSSISDMLSDGTSGFFLEIGKLTTQRYFWAIHAVWANAPMLDNYATAAGGEGIVSDLLGQDPFVLDKKISALAGASYMSSGPSTGAIPYGFASPVSFYTEQKYLSKSASTYTLESAVVGRVGLTNQVSVAAGTKVAISPTLTLGQALFANGDSEHTIVHGGFANTATKRLYVENVGGTIWDSGDLTDSGEWTLTATRVKNATGASQYHIRFETETTKKFAYFNSNNTSTTGLWGLSLKVTSSTNGDVIVRSMIPMTLLIP